jgi:hypothetical protein
MAARDLVTLLAMFAGLVTMILALDRPFMGDPTSGHPYQPSMTS